MGEYAKAIVVDADLPEITGTLRAMTSRTAPWDQNVTIPIWTLRGPSGGERSLHGVPAVLRRLMVESDAMVGEQIVVRYVGKQLSAARRDFVVYELDFPEREPVIG